ncbi:MAG: NAD(P)-dependent alcohol dehydrogenase [Chloroflexota bacterium]
MNAIVYTKFGPPNVLQRQEMDKPTPKDNELLIRIRATSVNYGDLIARNFKAITPRSFNMPFPFWLPARLEFGISQPKKRILGSEFAGDVEAVGNQVTQFKAGDAVFGYLGARLGAYADYVCLAEDDMIAHMPKNMRYEEATAGPYGTMTAMNLLKKTPIKPGQKVLINGASGSIGSAAVQLAKLAGAEVTGVCSKPRIDYVQALGADHTVDYTQDDFTQNGEQYDLIFDILGKSSFAQVKGSLRENGRYLRASFKTRELLQMAWTKLFGSKKVICALSLESYEDLLTVKELVEAGQVKTIIDRCFPLAEAAEAHRYVEAGQTKGKVVLQTYR